MSGPLKEQSVVRTRLLTTSATMVAVVLVAFACVDVVWSVIAPLSRPAAERGRAGATVSTPLVVDNASLTQRNPFAGAPDAEDSLSPADLVEDIPVTTAQLVLKGTNATGDESATAIVRTPDNKELLFQVGDQIIRGVRLHWVENYRVIVLRNGRREQLLLQNRPEIDDKSIPDASPVVVSPSGVEENDLASDQPAKLGPPLKSVAGRFMTTLEANGFSPDDIPLAIDGNPIPPQKQAIEALFDRLKSKSSIMVTVLRDGEEQDITLSLTGGIQP